MVTGAKLSRFFDPGNGLKIQRVDTDPVNGVSGTASILGCFSLAGAGDKTERLKRLLTTWARLCGIITTRMQKILGRLPIISGRHPM
jgi:hypothetical protein